MQTDNYLHIINEFAVQIATLNSVDEIVWAIAKYAIARMDFVDCVVYLANNEGELIQRAAHGPKNPRKKEIYNPIVIPFGQGIVGTTAQTQRPQLISDTSKDSRYILDDEARLSELAVPILYEGKTIGIIDSEHPQVDFFTQYHQDILTTVALLVAPRIAYVQLIQKKLILSESKLSVKTSELSHALTQLQSAQKNAVQAKDEAMAVSHAKSEFISKMSHELRTPLTGIMGYAQLLLSNSELTKSQHKGLSVIDASARHMAVIIENILTYSKQEHQGVPLEPESVDLSDFMLEVGSMMQLQAETKHVDFVVSVPDTAVRVMLDPARLRQVLFNLLGNAIKFTASGSVQCHVDVLDKPDGNAKKEATCRFVVRDTGLGIAPNDVARIFIPFEQSGTIENQTLGTGLGLPISRQIVQEMGGDIHVESEVGKGSRFWFELTFPRVSRSPRVLQDDSLSTHSNTRKSILIVDDVMPTRLLFKSMLGVLGLDVFEAASGKSGIALAQEKRPDLIIMDWLMPEMDGLEAIEHLRKMPECADIPILVSSAHIATAEDMDQITAVADGFLSKPIDINDLRDNLARLLQLEWIN